MRGHLQVFSKKAFRRNVPAFLFQEATVGFVAGKVFYEDIPVSVYIAVTLPTFQVIADNIGDQQPAEELIA